MPALPYSAGSLPLIEKGFTLIEVLAALAIVSILAIVVFRGAVSAVERANTSKCLSNMRQIGIALQSYAADNNADLPPSKWGDTGSAPAALTAGGQPNGLGLVILGGYFGNKPTTDVTGSNRPKVLECPSKNGKYFFSDPNWSSYAYQSPRTTGSGAVDFNQPQKTLIPGGWALAIDASQTYRGWPAAHQAKLTNVLYADGHVESRPFITEDQVPGWGVWLGKFDLTEPRQ